MVGFSLIAVMEGHRYDREVVETQHDRHVALLMPIIYEIGLA